ncbi:MAG: alpha/beta hydrolase, partial [Bacteroidota bacterium]
MASIENETQEGSERKFTTKRTARFMTLGQANADTREVWVVFHGYGQLVRYFIRHFHPLANHTRFMLAPEGLSRFYLGDGEWQRVGASWMTKESRLDEIDDQLRFLNQLFAQETQNINWAHTKLVLFGFSQGVATAWRWLLQGKLPVSASALVAWAGMPPQELEGIDKHPKLDIY